MENNENKINDLENVKLQLEEYKDVMKDLFGDYLLATTDEGKISLLSGDGEKYEYLPDTNNSNIICFRKKGEFNYKGYTLSKLENHTSVTETIIKFHQKGAYVEYVDRLYGEAKFYNEKNALLDLTSLTCVVDDSYYENMKDLINPEFVIAVSSHTTKFSAHMRTLYKFCDDIRTYDSTMYPSQVFLNNKDISYMYDYVEGVDKVSRIYNLYKGNNKIDLYDIRSLINEITDIDSYNLQKKSIGEKVIDLIGKKMYEETDDHSLEEYIYSRRKEQDDFTTTPSVETSDSKEENIEYKDDSKVKKFIKRILNRKK